MKVNNIIEYIENFAPVYLKESWDNVGLLVGDRNSNVRTVVISMDLTDYAIDYAIKKKANMIITHHPIIYTPINNVNSDTVVGRKVLKCIKNDIAVYTAHTNFDFCLGGVTDSVCELVGLKNKKVACIMDEESGAGIGRIGELEKAMKLEKFLEHLNDLGFANIKYMENDNLENNIKKICVLNGAFERNTLRSASKENCDVFLTGDISYHNMQECLNENIRAISVGHYDSELPGLVDLEEKLRDKFDIEVFLCDYDEVSTEVFGNAFDMDMLV